MKFSWDLLLLHSLHNSIDSLLCYGTMWRCIILGIVSSHLVLSIIYCEVLSIFEFVLQLTILGTILVIQRILDHQRLFILPLSASLSISFMKVFPWLLLLLSGDLYSALEFLFVSPYFEVDCRSEWKGKVKN